MNKSITKRLAGAMFAAAALCFSGCSSKPSTDVYSLASSDDLLVVRANAKTIIENAGGTFTATGIDFPADLMQGMSKEARTALAARGIDFEHIVANVTANNEIGVTFTITDQKAFDEYLTEVFPNTSVNEEKGYTFRKIGDDTYMFTNSGIGYMLEADDNGVDRLEQMMQKSKENPVAAWQKTAVEEGNALGLTYNMGKVIELFKKNNNIDLATNKALTMQYDSTEFVKSYVKVNCTLEGTKFTANSEVVNNEGGAMKSKMDVDNVDTSMLKYADAGDQMVALCSMPKGINWDEVVKSYMEMMSMPTQRASSVSIILGVASVLENIDGTVLLGFGATGTASVGDFDAVIAAQMKDGKAADYLQQIQSLASLYGQSMGFASTLSGSDLTIKGRGFEAYGKADGNTLVLSLKPITGKGGCTIPASIFNGKTAAAGVEIAKDSALAGLYKIPFGVNAEAYNVGNGGRLSAELTGVEGGFIENILRVFNGK